MARYQVILAYDGTEFFGFQRQAQVSEIRTVQAVLESALHQIGWDGHSVLAAGRTDTGVHACGQVVAFDLAWKHSSEALLAALNANLPPDVAAHAVKQARPDFHPRYDALSRRYRYRIFCSALRDPLRERYAWRVWPVVDLERLHQAAAHLPGLHDFGAFGAPTRPGGATLRNVFRAIWQEEDAGLAFEIEANAFLYHMVRRIVGFQIAIGQGVLETSAVREHLEGGLSVPVRSLAPPHGLILVEVIYPDLEREEPSGEIA